MSSSWSSHSRRCTSTVTSGRVQCRATRGDRRSAASENELLLVVPLQTLHFDGHLGSLGTERADRRSHQDAGAEADDEMVCAAAGALHASARGIGAGKEWTSVVKQLASSGSQGHRALVADEELRAELALER